MYRVLSVVAFSLFIFSNCNAGDPCPSKDKLSPCTCIQKPMLKIATNLPVDTTTATPRKKRDIHDNYTTPEFTNDTSVYTIIKCEHPKTLSDLEEKVSFATNRKWIDKLLVSHIPPEQGNTLARLPSNWLKNGRIRELEITNTQLIGDFIWNGMPLKEQHESLYWLKVNDCYLFGALTYDTVGTVQTRGLNMLRRLQGIDFSSNHMTVVSATAFKVPPVNLTTIVLANNNIQHIDSAAFQNIPLLKYIDLSHNLLTTVARTCFAAPARHLKYIDMSWNSMQNLAVNFFDNMPALKSVDLSKNFLPSLPARPWSVVWKQLSFIDVSGNFIECDCQLLWLLPVLQTPKAGVTQSNPLPAQTIIGQCLQTLMNEDLKSVTYDLAVLKRDRITC